MTTELRPGLYLLALDLGQVYAWRDEDGVTLVDAGAAGSGPALRAALAEAGIAPGDVRRLVLTHWHADHTGGAAEIAAWGDVEVLAGAADAPVIRAAGEGAPPDLSPAERELWVRVTAGGLPPAPPCRVDRELVDGDELEITGGARVLAVPGHTEGSVALHLTGPRVLFTGDAVAESDGGLLLGPFNADRDGALESYRRLGRVDADVACFGHGRPVVGGAGAVLAAAAANPVVL